MLLHQTDLARHVKFATVAKVRESTLALRSTCSDGLVDARVAPHAEGSALSPLAGGGYAFFTSSSALNVLDPVESFFLNASCESFQAPSLALWDIEKKWASQVALLRLRPYSGSMPGR